jgi:hypothetical protein
MKLAKHTRITGKVGFLFFLLFFGTAQAASMYKWIDEEGNIHYSQVPPEDQEAQKIEAEASPPPPSAPESKTESDAPDILPPGLQPTGAEGAGELDRQKCFEARRNLEVLMRQREVTLPDGKKMVFSEEMRRQKIDEAREEMKRYCGY